MKTQLGKAAIAVAMLLCLPALGAPEKPATPAAPEKPESLVDPAANALQSYLFGQVANDEKLLKSLVHVSAAEKQHHADAILAFLQASRVLERQTVAKFGPEEGLRPQGHVRSFDDQYKLDLKRVRDANVQYNSDKSVATVFLRIELRRPENLQMGDRFNFLDSYDLIKTGGAWKLDFLKTYKCLDPEQEENYKSELVAYPKMAKIFLDLAESVKKGQYKSAEELKNYIEDKWNKVYDEPTRIQLKPGEKPPGEASGVEVK